MESRLSFCLTPDLLNPSLLPFYFLISFSLLLTHTTFFYYANKPPKYFLEQDRS